MNLYRLPIKNIPSLPRRHIRLGSGLVLLSCLVVSTAVPASAQPKKASSAETKAGPATPKTVEGSVLKIDGADIVLDLNSGQGVAVGDQVQVWRGIKLRHPVTHKWVNDRFRTGSLTITQVGAAMSLAHVSGKMLKPIKPGDIVIATIAQAGGAGAKGSGEIAEVEEFNGAKSKDPDTAAVCDMFRSLSGAPVTTRILAYENYVRKNPRGKYAPVLYEEAQALRRVLQQGRRPKSVAPTVRGFRPPSAVIRGTTLDIGIELSPNTSGVVLHVRKVGTEAFYPVPMIKNGDGYWTTRIDGRFVARPGLEYFIEASGLDGVAHAVVGAADTPKKLSVLPLPVVDPASDIEASAAITTDYASYNGFEGNDYAWQTQGDFGMYFREVGIRAVRTGFGVYRGAGGSLEELDELHMKPRRIGLTYGYIESEFGLNKNMGLILRGLAGLKEAGMTSGWLGAVRLGRIHDTNLQLGIELLGGVGDRGFAELQLGVFPKVPMMVRIEMSNQPAGVEKQPVFYDMGDSGAPGDSPDPKEEEASDASDIGGRGIFQVGYQFTPEFTLSARISYQGRTIQHAGPGFGGGISYQW